MFVLVGLSFYIFPIYLLSSFIVNYDGLKDRNVWKSWILSTLVYSIFFSFWNMTPLMIKLFGVAKDPDSVQAKKKSLGKYSETDP